VTIDRVAAVLVNWNSAPDVLRTIGAIRAEYSGLTTVVVDNASADDDWSQLDGSSCHDVVLDRLPENRGYAAGVNRALNIAKDRGLEWAWLLNPDALPYPGCLEQLLASSDGCALLGPRQLSSSEPLSADARPYVSAARSVGSRLVHETCPGCSTGHHDVHVVTGTGLLVHVELAHAVGLMNEQFFHYKEEFEFAERLAAVARVRYVCHATLWHERGGSMAQESPQANYYRVRNELLYLSLRLGRAWRAHGRTWRWVVRSALDAFRAQPDSRRAILRGVADGLRGRWGKVG
jgi:GT2 family glycosyltransferase